VFEQSFEWIREHQIFDPKDMGAGKYEGPAVSLTQ